MQVLQTSSSLTYKLLNNAKYALALTIKGNWHMVKTILIQNHKQNNYHKLKTILFQNHKYIHREIYCRDSLSSLQGLNLQCAKRARKIATILLLHLMEVSSLKVLSFSKSKPVPCLVSSKVVDFQKRGPNDQFFICL